MDSVEFLRPRLRGSRFDNGEIPLEVLGDLVALGEMVLEVAKWRFLKENPQRQRIPRGFTDSVNLKLTRVERGSATPVISIAPRKPGSDRTSFPYQRFFDQAREDIANAIDAVDPDGPGDNNSHLPTKYFAYFNKIGRSLREDESLELPTPCRQTPARLTRQSRLKLVQISRIREFTQEVTLRGSISEVDQTEMTFELQPIYGHKVVGPIPEQHHDTVMEAFNGYRDGARVVVSGIGRYDHPNRLLILESAEQIDLLDPLDVPARLDELRSMEDGWLDGYGKAPDHRGLDWLTRTFERNYPDDLPLPYTYPTPEGGVQMEWSLNSNDISLEIDLFTHIGEWHHFDMNTDESHVRELDSDCPDT